jgi:hypothetical protein
MFAELVAKIDRAVQSHLGGVPVVYQPEHGAAVEVTGLFDENYTLVDPSNSSVEQVGPVVWLRLEDLPVHPEDDEPTLLISGTSYRVRERQTDGAAGGGIRLLLHKVGA